MGPLRKNLTTIRDLFLVTQFMYPYPLECKYCSQEVSKIGDLCPNHAKERSNLSEAAMTFLKMEGAPTSFIQVYPWVNAPQSLRDLSDNGGDEDWVVVLPPGMSENRSWYFWLQKMDTCDSPQEYVLQDGWVVVIGSHA